MSDARDSSSSPDPHEDTNLIETIQSLLVAFVVAMTFRAFVTEGFVIPTGSMAPTLLGEHFSLRAPESGWEYSVGVDAGSRDLIPRRLETIADPMRGPMHPGTGRSAARSGERGRAGDRILIHKSKYPFSEPKRFDVVVFKNPTNPNGDDGNFIKRLIGLPGEAVWIIDGDVFAAPVESADDFRSYQVQRKPEHVQRAVWQPIYRSVYAPDTETGARVANPLYGDGFEFDDGAFRMDGTRDGLLEWNKDSGLLLDDWAPYNQLMPSALTAKTFVGDFRIAGTVTAEAAGYAFAVELVTRSTEFQFQFEDGRARVRRRPADFAEIGPEDGWLAGDWADIAAFAPGVPVRVECWHVDQSLSVFVDGDRVIDEPYEWTPRERLEAATGRGAGGDDAESLGRLAVRDPGEMSVIRIRGRGAPARLSRVEVDRDIHYARYRVVNEASGNPPRPDEGGLNFRHAFASHPTTVAELGDDHFFMLGDNTLASSDSRAWGFPHPLVAEQVDPTPFVVHRSMLLGKAWVVYFPALESLSPTGRGFVPNFGDLRFIR